MKINLSLNFIRSHALIHNLANFYYTVKLIALGYSRVQAAMTKLLEGLEDSNQWLLNWLNK